MIKFVYIGDQLVDGGKQFCFVSISVDCNSFVCNFLFADDGKNSIKHIFDSWDDFCNHYEKSGWSKRYELNIFKSLMPAELLQKDEKEIIRDWEKKESGYKYQLECSRKELRVKFPQLLSHTISTKEDSDDEIIRKRKELSIPYNNIHHHKENKVIPSSKILNHALKLSIEDNPYAGIFKEEIAEKFIIDAILNYLDEIAVLYNK